MTTLDDLQKQLKTIAGISTTPQTLDLWDQFLRGNGYVTGNLLVRIRKYARDVNLPVEKLLTGQIMPVDTNPATAPGAPTIISLVRAGSGAIAVGYTPAAANGAEITSYTITSSPGLITATGISNPLTITGLSDGTSYTFTMTATNSVGTGPASAVSSAITPATVPGVPTAITPTKGNAQVSVAFTAPASTGGSAITGYTVLCSNGTTATGASSPIVVTGLTNGVSYTFQVKATNVVGDGPYSDSSAAAIPSTVPGAPINLVAALATDTSASISFDAPVSNGGSAITSYTVTSSPNSLTANGSASPLTITGLTPGITYTFTATATNANGTGAVSVASNSVTAVATGGSGPFDALYAGSWTPIENTTVYTPPVMSQPAKSTGINSPSYTDGNYGTKIFRVAQISDSPNNGTTKMRHEYSRRQPFNCDGTKYMIQNSSGFYFVYDANTFQCLDGGVTTNDVKLRAVGTNTRQPKDPRDWIWHPTDPNKIIYFPQTDGLILYEFDVVTHVETVKADFTGRLGVFGTVTKLTASEGRPSDNGRYWGWQVFNGTATVGYMTWDMQLDTITGTLVTSDSANNTTMSSGGNYIIISAGGAGLTYAQCAASSSIRGTRAYTRDFSSFKQVHVTATHADVGYDYLGNECYVSLNPGSSTWTAIAQNSLFYITLNDAAGPVQLIDLGSAMSQWNSHYSACCAPGRPGWSIFSAYDSTNRAGFPRWLDNTVTLVELKPSGHIYRLANHRTTRLTYWQEPHATISRDGLRVLYSCSWDNTTSTQAALDYMIGLPSWIYGGAVPPLLNFTFDSSTGWSLGTSCSITVGKLWCNNNAANVTNSYATGVLLAGTYDITYTISEWVAGNMTMRINSGGTIVSGTTRTFGVDAAGTYTDRVTIASTSTAFEVRVTRSGGTSMDMKVDNITVVSV